MLKHGVQWLSVDLELTYRLAHYYSGKWITKSGKQLYRTTSVDKSDKIFAAEILCQTGETSGNN